MKTLGYQPIDLSLFPKTREEKLRQIFRASVNEVKFYRSHLWIHEHRVCWMIEELLPLAQKHLPIDPEKCRTLALVHDDAEIITGDVQSGHKERMSPRDAQQVEQDEEKAIQTLSRDFPKMVNGYNYQELLYHALRKDCLEAQLVSYVDKLDAYCEALHDTLAGNISDLFAVIFYVRVLSLFANKFPNLTDLLNSRESPLTGLNYYSLVKSQRKNYQQLNKPHSLESIKMPTDFPFYNTWRRLIIEKGGKEGLDWLTTQKEFL